MRQQRVLVIDDEPDIRELLEITLLRMGLDTVTAATVKEAMLSIQEFKPDLCLTDMRLPDGSGIDIVRYIQRKYPHIPVALITAYGSMEAAVEALKAGAYDFVSKPVDLTKLRDLVQTALKLSEEGSSIKKSTKKNKNCPILGQSTSIKQLKATIAKLARSQAPVFVHGESGSGKELVARQIHQQSPRASSPFVPVNCGAIPENLMESEFFGHKKGSFTGAMEDKIGLFQASHHGTLFLDEVADLPLGMQVKLLRAIQEKAVKPVGAVEEIAVDSRILSATHKDLEAEVASGRFRQDLYYRLNVIKLDVPPLRERESDVLLLAEYFLTLISSRWQLPNIVLSSTAKQALVNYNFPGNVRELENILERASTLCDDNIIQPEDLQLPDISPIITTAKTIEAKLSASNGLNPITSGFIQTGSLQSNEKDLILQALDQTRWNRTAAAKLLGMTFRQLRYRIKKYGLDQS
ncbi:MAG TPA: sigma-54-dependent Fis family transcriptional regulator [Gammaproteobacteria bacterium]|nr:sigma-54-dependent Fis family transcriptional regulator [Gammaproteobacteria bacterium]